MDEDDLNNPAQSNEEEDWNFSVDFDAELQKSGLVPQVKTQKRDVGAWMNQASRSEADVLRLFFELRPGYPSTQATTKEVMKRTNLSYTRIVAILKKAAVQKEAKKQRAEYADKIYGEKIPLAKSIVGKSLVHADNYLTTYRPKSLAEAQMLVKIASDLTSLLRLEMGQSTEKIEIMHKTQKTVDVIVSELRDNDPFVDYPKAPSEDAVEIKPNATDPGTESDPSA